MMNITLTLDLEQLVKSQLQTGKYATVEQVIAEALLLLEANNRSQAMSQKVKNLFDKTQAIQDFRKLLRRKSPQKLTPTGSVNESCC